MAAGVREYERVLAHIEQADNRDRILMRVMTSQNTISLNEYFSGIASLRGCVAYCLTDRYPRRERFFAVTANVADRKRNDAILARIGAPALPGIQCGGRGCDQFAPDARAWPV
jgi:hypothetical protein